METRGTGESWRTSWYFALGAGWCGFLLLAGSWLLAGKPYWLQLMDGTSGWTIYPPLSALPQAIPGGEETVRSLLETIGCGGLFLAAWLRAWWQRRTQQAVSHSPWFKWSFLLLVPMVIQIGGILYTVRLIRAAEADVLWQMRNMPSDTTAVD